MIAQREARWYDDIATILAEESDYLAEIRESNRILMEQALGNICGACGGAGVIRRDTERDDIRLTSYAQCAACNGTGEHHTPADEPVTDAIKHVPCRWRNDQTCPHPAKCHYGYECEARPVHDEPVTDAALIDAYLDGLAAREMATNDQTEG